MPAWAQFGIAINGVGPVNASMGGASVAAPLDSAGAIYWNPATIGELGSSETEFGLGLLIPRTTLSSRVPAGAFGNGVPALNSAGSTAGNNGVFLLPAISVVYRPEESPWSYGLGILEIGGFAVNYPVSRTNPILNPRPPFGVGIGPLYTQLQIIQFSPTIGLSLTDQWSVGFQANIDYGIVNLNPVFTSAPTLVETPFGPVPSYGSGDQGRSRAGGGFQVGVYYNHDQDWSFGASIKSPQWFDTYRFNASNPTNGNPATTSANINFPMTGSVGFAYKGIDRLLWATDFRILDYRDTTGFSQGGFDNRTGILRGLGWQNVFAIATGVQYQWTDTFSTRIGYSFNLNPIGPALTSYNVGSPLVIQHALAVGASYNVTEQFKISLAYVHDFQNTISGPLVEPFVGRIHGATVQTSATADIVFFGATVTF
jgi:long-chain fatty acid transport protein